MLTNGIVSLEQLGPGLKDGALYHTISSNDATGNCLTQKIFTENFPPREGIEPGFSSSVLDCVTTLVYRLVQSEAKSNSTKIFSHRL